MTKFQRMSLLVVATLQSLAFIAWFSFMYVFTH